LIAVASSATCGAEASAPTVSDWRRALAAEYAYVPAAAAPALAAPQPSPGTVLLPAVVVDDRNPALAQLGLELQAIRHAQELEDQNRRLGIGYHSIGTKRFRVGYVSVFHLPVFLVGGFSW
jgi:hypothetical protein